MQYAGPVKRMSPEKKTLRTVSFQGVKSAVGKQFLLPDRRAKAQVKGVSSSLTQVQVIKCM